MAGTDAIGTVAQEHIGPVRMRTPGAERNARAEDIAQANAQAARDPDQVLETLTRHSATFTQREVERHLAKHIFDAAERREVLQKVAHRGILWVDSWAPTREALENT